MNLRRHTLVALLAGATIFALAGCGKSTSPTAATPVLDTTPPNPPTNLSSSWVPSVGYDYLYWNLSTSPSVRGYEVYESATAGGALTKIAATSNTTADLILPPVSADCTRYYQLRARTNGGAFSAYSTALPVARHTVVGAAGSNGSTGSGVGLVVPD